jgi:hypothetical protein
MTDYRAGATGDSAVYFVVRPWESRVFKRCRRAWDFSARERQNYEPVEPPRVFDLDEAVHEALEVYSLQGFHDGEPVVVQAAGDPSPLGHAASAHLEGQVDLHVDEVPAKGGEHSSQVSAPACGDEAAKAEISRIVELGDRSASPECAARSAATILPVGESFTRKPAAPGRSAVNRYNVT